MPTVGHTSRSPFSWQVRRAAEQALLFVPLAVLQPILRAIAMRLARSRPDLFARMGVHTRKRFLIDPTDLPFVFVMVPDTAAPKLTAHARAEEPVHEGAISGRFFHLLDMIDGTLDGDALFFNRDLSVTGDVEAVVALRNALDDFDGDLVREILSTFEPFAGVGGVAVRLMRSIVGRPAHG